MNVCPIVMVRNEQYYIRQVLQPLARAFDLVLVGDTGSTDGTVRIARLVAPNVEVVEYGPQNMTALTQVRKWLCDIALERGYEYAMQVDGDELIHPLALAQLAALELPPGKRAGFTTMVSVDLDDNRNWLRLDDFYNRLAFYPLNERQVGTYPFEWPACFKHPTTYHYFETPPGLSSHGLHLHRLQRSPNDEQVYRRQEKQKQFAMKDKEGVEVLNRLGSSWTELLK